MRRRKGISALVLTLAVSTAFGTAVAPADPGGGRGAGGGGNGGSASGGQSTPGGQSGQGGDDSGSTRGSGGSGGGAGNGSSGGAGGNPGGGQGGNPTGGQGGRGSGSAGTTTVTQSSSSSASQGQGSGSGQSGRGGNGNGNGNGNSDGSSGNRCASSCHLGQQPPVGTPTFTALPTQTVPAVTSTPAPVTSTPAPTPKPSPKAVTPARTYSSTSSDNRGSGGGPRITPALVGVGVTPALGGARVTLGTSTGVPTASSGALNSLLGTVPVSTGSTSSNRFGHAQGKAPAETVTPPVAAASNVIERIERVIPTGIWIALAAALAFAAVAGAAALWSGHRVRRQAANFAAMTAAALTDPLTGILNRRGFTDAFERELARARRYNRPFVLAYVDVRGLKAVNDSAGHSAGDELLREAAQLLQASARANDVVGRLGGDEMGLLLVEQNTEGAEAVQRRIESQVQARRAAMGLQSSWDLTIGTASFPQDGESFDDLVQAADRRLYEQRGIELVDDPRR
jgi:diguanylate cyclase (GGDEF)-like protein